MGRKPATAHKPVEVPKPTDREKILEIATLLGCTIHERPSTVVMGGRRFKFNKEGEIVKIQRVLVDSTGATSYLTISEDPEHKAARGHRGEAQA